MLIAVIRTAAMALLPEAILILGVGGEIDALASLYEGSVVGVRGFVLLAVIFLTSAAAIGPAVRFGSVAVPVLAGQPANPPAIRTASPRLATTAKRPMAPPKAARMPRWATEGRQNRIKRNPR